MDFRSLALAALTLSASVAAFAGDTAVAAPAQPAASVAAPSTMAANDPDSTKLVCKREAQVGTLIATRICKTAAQWQQDRDNAQKMVGDMQQHTGTTFSK